MRQKQLSLILFQQIKYKHDIFKAKQKQKLKANTNSYLYQKDFHWITSLATSVNTASTESAIPVQQASHVEQFSDLPTLPNKNNASLEEQLKQQQLLIDKLTSRISALESNVQLWKGKLESRKRSVTCLNEKPMT